MKLFVSSPQIVMYIPKYVQDALEVPEWNEAVLEKIKALQKTTQKQVW